MSSSKFAGNKSFPVSVLPWLTHSCNTEKAENFVVHASLITWLLITVDQWMLRWVGVAWNNLHKSPSCTTEAFDRRSWWGQGGHRPSLAVDRLLRLDDGQRMTAESTSTRWGKDMISDSFIALQSNTLQLMAVAKHRIIEWWYLLNRWQILSTLIRLQFLLSI